jgi:hypothetical protein
VAVVSKVLVPYFVEDASFLENSVALSQGMLVSSGKVQEESLAEFDIIEGTRNKQVHEGAVPEDEYESFTLAIDRLKVYLDKSYYVEY